MRQSGFPQQSARETLETSSQVPIFSAMITPHRSLGPGGFWFLMGFVALSCFSSGIMFMVMGAWPIAIFLALDVLLLWGAFKLSYRSGRQYETVEIWRDKLLIRKFCPAGKPTEHVFSTFFAKFAVDRHDEIGITKMQLHEKERRLDIGMILNPLDRESFAIAFGQALARAKHH